MAAEQSNGLISIASHLSVDDTVARLRKILDDKGIILFAFIDHSGGAEHVGLKMRPSKLLIFGNPSAGTPLMIAAPTIAIDLPLKLLVWEDATGKVWISYNSADYLRDRHNLPPELTANISMLSTLAAMAVN